jgi:hypothetical protein
VHHYFQGARVWITIIVVSGVIGAIIGFLTVFLKGRKERYRRPK